MLVMSRRKGDTILIGDDIEIVIAHIGRSRVKVGICAPRAVPVIAREEKLVRDENRAAVVTSPSPAMLTTFMAQFKPVATSADPSLGADSSSLTPAPMSLVSRTDTGAKN
jgi:carbon storage regulator